MTKKPLRTAVIAAIFMIPLLASSGNSNYRIIVETINNLKGSHIEIRREAEEPLFLTKGECEAVVEEANKKFGKLESRMTNTALRAECIKDGVKDRYGVIYRPRDQATIVLQRGEFQKVTGREIPASLSN